VTVGYDELTSFVATELIDRQIQATPDSEVHVHADEVPETLREVIVWSLSVSDCTLLCEFDRHLVCRDFCMVQNPLLICYL